jgi:hypothetical protein
MLDPRIYRTGLVPVVLAVIVLAFSLDGQQGPIGSALAPDAFSGATAFATMNTLSQSYPVRAPGSAGDSALAGNIARQLYRYGFTVRTDTFRARTLGGTRALRNVVAVRAGQQNGSIVVVAGRDARGSPATAGLSGTAVMLELANVLSGETLQHTVVLASTDGSAGGAGAARLAQTLQQPVDAVLVLGDLAGTLTRRPIVVPWSNGQQLAPPVLRNTVAASLGAQTGLAPGGTGLIGQIAHLAFPMAATQQAPFVADGEPAVLLSLSGERAPPTGEPTTPARIAEMGRTVLQSVTALDGAPAVASPSTYLSFSGKLIPAWAVRLFVLALILPVLLATIDGVARARRRGNTILRWVGWVLAAAVPFVLATVLVLVARAMGLIGSAPQGPLDGGQVIVGGGAIALLVLVGVVIVAGLVWLRPAVARILRPGLRRGGPAEEPVAAGAAAGLLLVLCLLTVIVWLASPFAAILLVPALHLWMWIVVPDFRLPRPVVVLALLAGFALPALILVDYAVTLGLGPLRAAWALVLLLAGGTVGLLTALEWSVLAGCAFTAAAIAVRSVRAPDPDQAPVTIRGPVSYAGPGSLGGTKSALRR